MDFFEQSMYWLLAGSKGASNRLVILEQIEKKPVNLNELSKKVGLNYKTVHHHINLLLENNFIVSMGKGYGQVYFISDQLRGKNDLFKKMLEASKLESDGK